METQYFFCWIGSSIMFLLFIYLTKFKSYCKKNEESMNMDTIWQMKNSCDILAYYFDEMCVFNIAVARIVFNSINLCLYVKLDATDKINGVIPLNILSTIRLFMLFGYLYHVSSPSISFRKSWSGCCCWYFYFVFIISLYVTFCMWYITVHSI